MKKKGFTLAEILTSVVIVAILAAMAVPMYEKTIEKSRIVEARAVLKRIFDAKMRTLSNLEKSTYTTSSFGFEQLDLNLPCSNILTSSTSKTATCTMKNFTYSLNPTGEANAVCAVRCSGDYSGTSLLYYGSLTTGDVKFLCNGSGCEVYGLDSSGSGWCSC